MAEVSIDAHHVRLITRSYVNYWVSSRIDARWLGVQAGSGRERAPKAPWPDGCPRWIDRQSDSQRV
jgi:hypothetical protein